MPGSWKPNEFPDLVPERHTVTSKRTTRYNCIAWSVGLSDKQWWPDPWGVGAWFPGVPRAITLDAFARGYASVGYQPCDDGRFEIGFEKIALYAKAGPSGPMPTHAAYQLVNGKWTSKLGSLEDIEHSAEADLNGTLYGQPIKYFRRPRRNRPDPPAE
jgi:hypothetical protein